MTIITVLLILLLCFISYLLFFALKRINNYEAFILQFQQIIEYATEQMKQVDEAGHYEADDETGFFFKQLKDVQLLLNNIFEEEEENDIRGEKEKE